MAGCGPFCSHPGCWKLPTDCSKILTNRTTNNNRPNKHVKPPMLSVQNVNDAPVTFAPADNVLPLRHFNLM